MMHFTNDPAILAKALLKAPEEITPLIAAMNQGVALGILRPRSGPFEILDERASIVLVDDVRSSAGPAEFDEPSLAKAIRRAHLVAVVSAGGRDPYLSAALVTAMFQATGVSALALIVETNVARELIWLSAVRHYSPAVRLMLCSGEGAPQ